jgi:DNA-binding response OmpR family regulator
VAVAHDGSAALASVADSPPSLIVLDVMLPELDGLALLRIVRERSDVPIVMLSARGSVADRVYGINEGADDYLPKPFSPAELVVRVKSVLRRTAGRTRTPEPRGVVAWGDLSIDLDRFEVRRGQHLLRLTPVEFRLLAALVEAGGRVLTRQALMDALYGPAGGEAFERTVDVHIGRLRRKLGESPEDGRYVATVRGAGYRAMAL